MSGIRALPEGQRRRACGRLTADAFDLTAVGPAVAVAHWSLMRNESRRAIVVAVGERISIECVKLVGRADPATATLRHVRETGGGVRLTAPFQVPGNATSVVVWTLSPGGPLGWKATDLSVDGRAMIATLKGDFESALMARSGNVPETVAHFVTMVTR